MRVSIYTVWGDASYSYTTSEAPCQAGFSYHPQLRNSSPCVMMFAQLRSRASSYSNSCKALTRRDATNLGQWDSLTSRAAHRLEASNFFNVSATLLTKRSPARVSASCLT